MASRALTTDDFVHVLGQAIAEKIEELSRPLIDKAMQDLERQVRSHIGGLSAQIVSQLSYERMGTDLRITVHFPEKKP